MSCHVIFLASLLNSSIMAAGWPRRGFRNRGPVRESGSERRSRCGAARTASVRVWRRAHFYACVTRSRGRLRGSCALRACAWAPCTFLRMCDAFAWQAAVCREHAADVSRRCAVGIGFRARFVHAWPTCVSRDRLWGSGGVSRVCRGCVAALCRGDWVPSVFFTRMANVRFAWQAAGIVRAGRCVAGVSRCVSRRCAVGIGFRARCAHA